MQRHFVSQPDICRYTDLAQQSVSRIVKGLTDIGAIVGERVSSGRRGQPSISIRVVPEFAYTFGVAIMTDSFSVVLMDFSCQVLEEVHCHEATMDRPRIVAKINEIFENLLSKHQIDANRIVGVGVAISGYSLGGTGMYNPPRALGDWALINLVEVLTTDFGFPVWVENDANAAAVGESLMGAGKTYKDFVYLYLAAGIGGGVIINGELLRGCHGNGGEVGLILPSGMYLEPNLSLLEKTLTRNGVEVDGISDLLSRFDVNWPGVEEWLNKTQESFSLIVSALSAILDPEAIVFGGRIPASLSKKVASRLEIYDDARRASPRPLPQLMSSDLTDGGAIGAAALPLKQHFYPGGVSV
ncbi:ROK family transcriptional regulator [Sessilibacter corallicola]|uniref:ROK family transcriptional regulator n=1 Tax=Sessilibacter corallicola TaxID=2904075 RepID=UPI001E5C7841|nr:ROK family transcriptional regulator [Sessilibacter corallicola]MCE2028924.1 ROK family transcriptional regulator [Sessilibacter corallicola]